MSARAVRKQLRHKQSGALPSLRVLLIIEEDCEKLAATMEMFHQMGFEVVGCASYEAGLRNLETGWWDLVVVDQGSRDFEGRQVLERAVEIDRNLPVLVMARHHDINCYLDAMYLGAAEYVEEPVTMREMQRLLKAHFPFAGVGLTPANEARVAASG